MTGDANRVWIAVTIYVEDGIERLAVMAELECIPLSPPGPHNSTLATLQPGAAAFHLTIAPSKNSLAINDEK